MAWSPVQDGYYFFNTCFYFGYPIWKKEDKYYVCVGEKQMREVVRVGNYNWIFKKEES